MKNIIPALNELQLTLMDTPTRDSLSNLGKARKKLFVAIRETLVQSLNLEIPQAKGGTVLVWSFAPDQQIPAITKAQKDFLAKFDKIIGTD